MLVLSRKTEEAIVIDESITVVILGIQGRSVKIGIVAPQNVPIHRAEIHQRIAPDASQSPRNASSEPVRVGQQSS